MYFPVITFLNVDHSTQQVEINWINSTPNVVENLSYILKMRLWIPLCCKESQILILTSIASLNKGKLLM